MIGTTTEDVKCSYYDYLRDIYSYSGFEADGTGIRGPGRAFPSVHCAFAKGATNAPPPPRKGVPVRIGINGFGRIGRNIFRAIVEEGAAADDLEIVAVNDLTDPGTLAHLLKHDSVAGPFPGAVRAAEGRIVVEHPEAGRREFAVLSERDPAALGWGARGVEVVVESTGLFTKRAAAAQHLEAGARKVIVSAPAQGEDLTVVMGVNEEAYDPEAHHLLSNASCTTNCLAPVVKVLHREFGLEKGVMTTVHSYTNDQRLLDLPHSDLRRARAAGVNLIPTSTGAARAVSRVLPELEGRLDGIAVRVPTPNVSLTDLTAVLSRAAGAEEVNAALREAAEGPLRGILQVSDEPLVSVDFMGNPHSSIVDAPFTKVVGGDAVKVLAWYDNEWGFSCRVKDLIRYLGARAG